MLRVNNHSESEPGQSKCFNCWNLRKSCD